MVRSAATPRVSNHEATEPRASSFETRCFATLFGMRRMYLAQPPYSDLSMFQNTGVAGPSSTPVISLRQALGARYCPSGT